MANRIEGNQSCPQCSAKVPADSLFCPACGTPVRPSRTARRRRAASQTGPRGGSLWGLVGVLVVIGGVFAALHFLHRPHAERRGSALASGSKVSGRSRKTSLGDTGRTASPSNSRHRQAPAKAKTGTGAKAHRVKTAKPGASTTGHQTHKLHTPVHPKASKPPKLTTASGGWSQASLTADGATVTVTVPKGYDHRTELAAHNGWRLADPADPAERVTVSLLPPSASAPGGTNKLGPGAYGTPIAKAAGLATQTLYVEWPGHAWVAVAMAVPAADESWLATIAQSVRIG